jgi:hypothetical protein
MTTVAIALPRPTMILRLLAGRGTFRVGVQVTGAALAIAWDGDTFSHYASAIGLSAWLVLVSDAPEKAVLKVLPRTRLLGPAVARLALAMSATPTLVLLAALIPVALLAPRSAAVTYLAAGAAAACTGLLMTVSGLHRLRGRPALDMIAFGACGAVVLAVTTMTLLVGWAVQVHLLLVLAGTVGVTAVAVAALPRDWVRRTPAGPRRRLLGRMSRITGLLGVADLLDALCVPTVYLLLAVTGQADQSGALYLALLPAVALGQVFIYLLRLAQPATSHRLRGVQGRSGRTRAWKLLRRGERLGIGFAAVFATLLVTPGIRERLVGDEVWVPALGVLVGVLLILVLTVLYASFLLENTTNDALVVTSSGALVGLVATGLLAAAIVPWLGALGGMAALALAIPIRAHVMRRMLTSHGSE